MKSEFCKECTEVCDQCKFENISKTKKTPLFRVNEDWQVNGMYKCPECSMLFSKFALITHYYHNHDERGIERSKKTKKENKIRLTREEKNRRISEALKKSHAEGRHPGWSHINSNPERMSRPETFFNKILTEKGMYEKYNIKYGLKVSKYFLDFAILDLKIDIEIDGVQHLRNQTNIDHDITRDKHLISLGWEIYRISVKELLDENMLNELILFIENRESTHRKYNPADVLNLYATKPPVYGSRKDYMLAVEKRKEEKVRQAVEKLLNSDIEFGKFGWVNKASNIIGIRHQKVNKWMKKNMKDFYEKNCYKNHNSSGFLRNI